jgi:asparagine synthase (glutamine-hydrolysing)
MCGIAGYSASPGVMRPPEMLQTVCNSLFHRGPDDSGIFEDATLGIGLVHARLSILDLSTFGHQPMFSEDKKVALVFNGEIYNFRELRAELAATGHIFQGHSDTEVLLHLYLDLRKRGGDFASTLRRLNGIFAFAIWDVERDELLLVRDALGVKPLYYSEEVGQFAFASEIKALLHLLNTACSLDLKALYSYMTFLWCPGDATLASNIRKLGPGEFLSVRKGVIQERGIWYRLPAFSFYESEMDEYAAIEGTVEHLRAAVHRQLVSDVPVGAFLSGGLDSSSVVAFARELNPDIRCFTIELHGGADAGITDDLPYARRIAKYLGVPLEIVRTNSEYLAEELANMVSQLDEPLADPAPLNVLFISRLARECGIKVLLSGVGGDDLFTGYRRHRAVLLERYWDWLPVRARQTLASVAASFNQNSVWGRQLRKAFDGAALQGDVRLINYFAWSQRNDLLALYTPEFRAAVTEVEAAKPMLDFISNLPNNLTPLERMLVLEQRFFLADHNLIYTDKMSMAVGVEVRVPFLDLELVEFAQQIPIYFKQRGGESKWVLKKAMEPFLPKDVIYRRKTGFGLPLRRWMRFELRDLISDVLGVTSLRRRGLFDSIAVQKLIAANDAGRIDASYTLLSLMCIELWCRQFMDKIGERQPHYQEGFS